MPRPLTKDEIDVFRGDLCRAATRLFAEEGIDGVTLRAIAREMGCSPMTPYRYFSNKEEIFRAVRLQWFEEFGRRTRAAFDRHPQDPAARFEALGRAYLAFALDEPHAYRLMFQLDRESLPADDETEAVTRGTWEPLLQTTRALVEAGLLQGDPNVIAHLAWVSLHGTVALHLSGHLNFDLSIDDLIDPVLRMLMPRSSPRPAEEVS